MQARDADARKKEMPTLEQRKEEALSKLKEEKAKLQAAAKDAQAKSDELREKEALTNDTKSTMTKVRSAYPLLSLGPWDWHLYRCRSDHGWYALGWASRLAMYLVRASCLLARCSVCCYAQQRSWQSCAAGVLSWDPAFVLTMRTSLCALGLQFRECVTMPRLELGIANPWVLKPSLQRIQANCAAGLSACSVLN